MARVYKASVTLNFWKRHICAHCAAGFRYRVRRSLVGQGPNEDTARRNLDSAVAKALTATAWQRCPSCGYVQPEMVGARRAGWHMGAALVGLVVLAVLTGLGFGHVVPHAWVCWLAAGVGAVLAAVQLSAALRNPNSDLRAGRAAAAAEGAAAAAKAKGVTEIVLEHEPPAHTPPRADSATLTDGRWPLGFALVGLALLGLVAAEGTRMVAGWPLNPRWYPGVAGPGDTTRHYLGEKLRSLKGYWSAQATVRVRSAESVGLPPLAELEARSKRDSWGNNISAESSEERSRSTPWVDVKVLDRADLAGKELDLEMELDVTYPRIVGRSSFEIGHRTMESEARLSLAPPGAGRIYFTVWWVGLIAGGVMLLALGLLLHRRARSLPASESVAVSDLALAAEVLNTLGAEPGPDGDAVGASAGDTPASSPQ